MTRATADNITRRILAIGSAAATGIERDFWRSILSGFLCHDIADTRAVWVRLLSGDWERVAVKNLLSELLVTLDNPATI